MDPKEEAKFTLSKLLLGELWLKASKVPYEKDYDDIVPLMLIYYV